MGLVVWKHVNYDVCTNMTRTTPQVTYTSLLSYRDYKKTGQTCYFVDDILLAKNLAYFGNLQKYEKMRIWNILWSMV